MKRKIQSKNFISILFVLFIVIVFLSSILNINKAKVSNREARELSEKPIFTLQSFADGSYAKALDTFFEENFFLRDFFLELDSFVQTNILLKQNVIYFGLHHQLLEYFDKPDQKNIDKIVENAMNINKLATYLKSANKNLYVFNFSDNSYINEKKAISSNFHNYTYEIYDYFKKNLNDEIITIDLTDQMMVLNKEKQLFYLTDHHWNHVGAYYGYQAMIDTLNDEFPTIRDPMDFEDFSFEVVSTSFCGTYGRRVGKLNIKELDTIVKFTSPTDDDWDVKIGEEIFDTLFFDDKLKSFESDSSNDYYKNEYQFYGNGIQPLMVITNHMIKNDISITLFKDSFMHIATPYLADNFKNIYVIDLRVFDGDVYEYIDKSDAVVFANSAIYYLIPEMTSIFK